MNCAEKLEKLKMFYGENYILTYDEPVGGTVVPLMAEYRSRQPVSVFGFQVGDNPGPEAAEYIFFLEGVEFSADSLKLVQTLAKDADSLYAAPNRERAFTFLSIAFICETASVEAAKALKKYSLRKNGGKLGWSLTRVAVLTRDGDYSNRDGDDFKKLLQKALYTKGDAK